MTHLKKHLIKHPALYLLAFAINPITALATPEIDSPQYVDPNKGIAIGTLSTSIKQPHHMDELFDAIGLKVAEAKPEATSKPVTKAVTKAVSKTKSKSTIKPKIKPKKNLKKSQLKWARRMNKKGDAGGLPKDYMATLGYIESAFNPKADRCVAWLKARPKKKLHQCDSARGLVQFIRSTGKDYTVVKGSGKNTIDHRMNPHKSLKASIKMNQRQLTQLSEAGLKPTSANLYLAYNQGIKGITLIRKVAQGKRKINPKSKLARKMYNRIKRNTGRGSESRKMQKIKKFNKATASLFLKYRERKWNASEKYVRNQLARK